MTGTWPVGAASVCLIAEFQRLQGQKHEREALALAPREVTKQELDANAPPP